MEKCVRRFCGANTGEVSTTNGGLVVTKFNFPIILGLLIMSWFCSGQPNIRCVFHSPVFFLVSRPVDRIQTLERKLKALEDDRARRSTEDALITLRRHLNLPLNMFDRYEAVELLQSLVRLARNEAHEKADTYAATLDEVKARADLLDKDIVTEAARGPFGGSCSGEGSEGGHLHPEILLWGLSSSIAWISLLTTEALQECSVL